MMKLYKNDTLNDTLLVIVIATKWVTDSCILNSVIIWNLMPMPMYKYFVYASGSPL